MKLKYKKTSLFLAIGIVFTAIIIALYQPSPNKVIIVSTPEQDKYSRAFINYVEQIEKEGTILEKEIKVEESKSFIFIFRPLNTQELTENEVQNTTDIALRAVSIFESRGGIRHDDIEMAFYRPVNQNILLIKRHDMPELLSENTYGEMTLSIDNNSFLSIVNLAGPKKNGHQDYANSWSVIQAICLAYARDFQDSDPACNIISANAAAGWVGMDKKQTEELINSYGMTQLSYLGNKDYQYRFIDFVYEDFVH